jgi:hypothetical protein
MIFLDPVPVSLGRSTRSGLARAAFATSTAAVALLGLIGAAPAPSRRPPDFPIVTTLAGSGAIGIDDGPGKTATFVAPAGIAYDEHDNLIVADRDAQRIRSVSPEGMVSTLAGSSAMIPLGLGALGGYRDGPAMQASFNMPSAVLPMPDGSVLVADTYNHCLRLISHGSVSTFAGATNAGATDGPLLAARFARPMSLTRDSAGDIFVADPPNGVRRIDAQGRVGTLAFRDSQNVISVSAIPGSASLLLVASVSLIQRLDAKSLAISSPVPLEFTFGEQPKIEGATIIRESYTNAGPVSALAAFDNGDFVFTDALDSAVRLGQTSELGSATYSHSSLPPNATINDTRLLTATPPEDASLGVAGFRDGPGDAALVDEPVGIAISRSGRVAIADTGNRRIRTFSEFNRLTHFSAERSRTELPAAPNEREYRIGIVGNSMIWSNQAWHESIAGETEDMLDAAPHGNRIPRVFPIMRLGICSPAMLDLIDAELSTGIVDMVVLDLTTYGQDGGDGFAGYCFDNNWSTTLKAHLVETAATLKKQGIGFLVLNFPGPTDLPDEFAYFRIPKGPTAETGTQNVLSNIQLFHDAIQSVLSDSGVPTLDLWPAFLQAYGSADRVPLFNVWDHHLTPFGRKLLASQLAKRLLTTKALSASSH